MKSVHYMKMGDGSKYHKIKGKIFEYEGHEFIAHRGYNEDYFNVTHLKTGIAAVKGDWKQTRKDLLEDFPAKLKYRLKYFNVSLDKLISQAIKEHGLTPEFDEAKEILILDD